VVHLLEQNTAITVPERSGHDIDLFNKALQGGNLDDIRFFGPTNIESDIGKLKWNRCPQIAHHFNPTLSIVDTGGQAFDDVSQSWHFLCLRHALPAAIGLMLL